MDDILSPERVISRLVTQPVFSDLDPVSLRVIALASERWSLEPGAALFFEGDESDSAYFILGGSFALNTSEGVENIAMEGDLLHPLALIAELVRPMTATAQSACDVLKIPRTVFLRILDSAPSLALRLREKLSRELAACGRELKIAETAMAP